MATIINPYIAGSPIKGSEMFFDREDVFEFVQQTLIGQHRDNILVLYGQRRTGKTSILYQMHLRLDPRYLCIFVDLHGLALEGINGFLWELANHIVRVLKRNYRLDLARPNHTAFQTDARSFFEDEFLGQVWSACGDHHLLLMFDEAILLQERVDAGKLEPDIFAYLRHLMQHYEQLNFLFSLGSGLEVMEQQYAFLFNVGLYKKISFLDPEAAINLITQPAKAYYQVESLALGRILHITSGHPYYTQLLCHCLFNHWQQQPQSVVTIQDIEAILDDVVELGLAVLKHSWEESTPSEKAVLVGMATAMRDANRPVTTAAIQRVWDHIIPEEECTNAMRNLIARDVIVGQNEYHFTVDLLRLWIQKYERLEWAKEEIRDTMQKWISISSGPPEVKIPRRVFLGGLIGLAGIAVVGGTGWFIQSRNLPPGKTLRIYRGHDKEVTGVKWSRNGDCIASSDKGGNIDVWNSLNGIRLISTLDHKKIFGYTSCSWSPNGKYLAAGYLNGLIQAWDVNSNHNHWSNQNHVDSVWALDWSSDNKWIASASNDKTVQVWDVLSNNILKYLNHSEPVYDVSWSPDGNYLASGNKDGKVQIWDAVSGQKLKQFNSGQPVYAVSWSLDGKWIASGDVDGVVQIWNVASGHKYRTNRCHTHAINAVSWSPDGNYLASGSKDKTVRVWNMTDNKVFTYSGHSGAVNDVSWSFDGKQIASASSDQTVRVWEAVNDIDFFNKYSNASNE